MDPENKFDKHLKEKLNQHSEQVPAHIWEKIAEERKRRKAGYWRWWTLGLLLLFLGGGMYVMNKTGEKNEVAQSETAGLEEKKEISPAESTKPESGLTKIREGKSKRPISNAETRNPKPAEKRDLQNRSSDKLRHRTRQTENQHSTLTTSDAYSGERNKRTGSAKKKNNNEVTGKNNSDEPPPQASSTAPELSDRGLITAAVDSNPEKTTNETAETNRETQEQTTSKAEEPGCNGFLPQAAIDNPVASEIKDSLAMDAKQDSSTAKNDSVTEAIKAAPYFKKHFVSLELYISPEYATKKVLEENPSEPDPAYLNLRKESETIDNAFNTGINLRYEINRHYFVRAGVRYSVINETFYSKVAKTEAVPSVDTVIKGYIVDPFLPPAPIYGYETNYTNRTVYVDQVTHNRYTFIDIPVSAGVQMKLKQFNFYFSADIELNILAGSSGMIAGQGTADPIDLSSPQSPFKTISWSIQSGLGCAYHFLPAFEFILEPNFRKQLTSMTKEEYPLDQQYTRIGVMAGIKYNIP